MKLTDRASDMKPSLEIFVCRRSRENPKPCCVDNLTEEQFLTMKEEVEAQYAVLLVARGCQGLCPYKGFAIRSGSYPEIVDSPNHLKKKIEAYKKG